MRLGRYQLDVVRGGEFWLDGGAMFGVVPRAVWERLAPPDERNRIRLQTNCLLIRGEGACILVDTGVGDKEDDDFCRRFLVPTRHHLRLAFIMGYDLFPATTLETKRALLRSIHDGGWYLYFDHDPDVSVATLDRDGRGDYVAVPVQP